MIRPFLNVINYKLSFWESDSLNFYALFRGFFYIPPSCFLEDYFILSVSFHFLWLIFVIESLKNVCCIACFCLNILLFGAFKKEIVIFMGIFLSDYFDIWHFPLNFVLSLI